MVVDHDTGRRTAPGFGDWAYAVGLVSSKRRPSAAPAYFGPRLDLEYRRRSIPTRADVGFHIAVVNEQLGVRVECQVVGIANAAGIDCGIAPIEPTSRDRAARGLDTDRMTT